MEIIVIAVYIAIFLISISVHEYAHAYSAYLLGDYTAKAEGRLTLNPLKHIDWVGLFSLIVFQIGWSKPVPVNPYNFKNYKLGSLIVSAAGPASNGVIFILSALIFSIIKLPLINALLLIIAQINLMLMLFNLLPIPPADGYHILVNLLPDKISVKLTALEMYGPVIFLLFALIPNNPIYSTLYNLYEWIFSKIFSILFK